MKQLKILLALSVGIGIFIGSGCRKDIPVEEQEVHKTMDNLVVSPSFNWETTREINVTISTTIPELITGTLSRIFIYLGNPTEGGKLVITGSVGYEYPLTAKLRLPTAATTLHLQLIAGSGYSEVVEVPILDDLTYTFTGKGGEKVSSGEITEPDCTIGCDWSLSGGGSNTINNGQTYCITDDYDGFISITNGTLRICGTFNGTISMGSGNNACNLIVTSTGNAIIGSLSMTNNCILKVFGSATASIGSIVMNPNAQLINYGTTTINSNLNSSDLVRNFGTLTINGQYNMNGNRVALKNSGDLIINSNLNVINEVTNEGLIEVFGDINFHSCDVRNYCKIISHQNVNFDNVNYISNKGYIKSVLKTTINESSFLVLRNKSMISATEFIMYNTVAGQGSTNVIKCTGFGQIIGTRYVSGVIEMLTPDGTLLSGSYPANFENGATLLSLANASVYIPTDDCNPEGSGPPELSDADGDGVPDALDDYPQDIARAYNNWHPTATTFGSLVFEDLWPSKGDFDMNDAVIDYQYLVVTNAQNKVVDIKPKFYIRAAGAALKNGFGFQLNNILPVTIESVTGFNLQYNYISLAENGLENLQDFAVVIVWDNADNIIHRVGPSSMFNTLRDYPSGYADTIYINLHFATPQPQNVVGTPPYNPFIIKNMDRNIEIHMPDYVPTSLANAAFFGTQDDDSDPATGRYYKTEKNLPWGMNITEKYNYTYEMVPIIYGYHHFAEWCESDGVAYPDWYKDLPGYQYPYDIYSITE